MLDPLEADCPADAVSRVLRREAWAARDEFAHLTPAITGEMPNGRRRPTRRSERRPGG